MLNLHKRRRRCCGEMCGNEQLYYLSRIVIYILHKDYYICHIAWICGILVAMESGMKRMQLWLILIFGLGLLGGCGKRDKTEAVTEPTLTLYVAAGLTDVVQEIGNLYMQEHDVELVYNFASSGALAQQLMAAPRADVYLSASLRWMDEVEESGHVLEGSRRELFRNGLVVIANPSSSYSMQAPDDLQRMTFKYLAVGDPASVPAGRYAKQWLAGVKLPVGDNVWASLQGRLSPAPDVRAAMGQVLGSADVIGVVYRTDYMARSDELKLIYDLPVESGPDIRFSGAVIRESELPEEGARFLAFMQSEAASELLKEAGFIF